MGMAATGSASSALTPCAAIMLADTSDYALTFALVFVGVAIGFWTLRRAAKRQHNRPSPRQRIDELKQASGAHKAMGDLLLELEEFSRRTNAQLDTKCAKLEQLIHDADERIARLNGGNAHHTAAPTSSVSKQSHVAREHARQPTAATPPAEKKPHTPQEIRAAARQQRSQARSANPGASRRTGPTPPGTPNERVYQLADEGRAPIYIAQELDLTLGEVELILRLRD